MINLYQQFGRIWSKIANFGQKLSFLVDNSHFSTNFWYKTNLKSKFESEFELESSRRFRWISATNSDRKSRFEYDLDQTLAGGQLYRMSLPPSTDVMWHYFRRIGEVDAALAVRAQRRGWRKRWKEEIGREKKLANNWLLEKKVTVCLVVIPTFWNHSKQNENNNLWRATICINQIVDCCGSVVWVEVRVPKRERPIACFQESQILIKIRFSLL